MKLNTVLLTSAATLMATSVAFAADLPSKKAAPSAGSVQVCKVAGKTGFTLPGSDTCVVLSGYVWAEANITGNTDTGKDTYSGKVREQLNVDTYSNTEMGVLHGKIGLRGNQTSSSSFAVNEAYVQLGGFTVGWMDSTFSSLDGGPTMEAPGISSSTTVMQAGYVASLGGGMKVGVALEQQASSTNLFDIASWNYKGGLSNTGEGYFEDPNCDFNCLAYRDYSYSLTQKSVNRMPDVVATVDFSASMVDVHLAAAFHQSTGNMNYSVNEFQIGEFGDFHNIYSNATSGHWDETGYALDGAVTLHLDSLGKGDTLAIEASYADGAIGRLASLGIDASRWADNTSEWWSTGSDGETSHAKNTHGYTVGGNFHHNFNDQVGVNVFAAYTDYTRYGTWNIDNKYDYNSTLVGMNVDWQPVKNFHVKPEIWHLQNDNDGTKTNSTAGVLRIQRDF